MVRLAYADLQEAYRNRMALETFCNTIGNAYHQRHLMTVEMYTVEAAVRVGSDFLQIGTTRGRMRT